MQTPAEVANQVALLGEDSFLEVGGSGRTLVAEFLNLWLERIHSSNEVNTVT